MKRQSLFILLTCLALSVLGQRFVTAPEPQLNEAPIQAFAGGKEIVLGMTREELLDAMGPPPIGYDCGDELFWAASDISRCFLEDDRVVAIQTNQLLQNGKTLVDRDCTRRELWRRLGPGFQDGETLVFQQDEKQIVVGLEPELFGDYVLFIGITRPDFNHDRLQTGCFPIADLETPTPSTLL